MSALPTRQFGGFARRAKIKVKTRGSNGPLFHLVPFTGRLLLGSGRGGL